MTKILIAICAALAVGRIIVAFNGYFDVQDVQVIGAELAETHIGKLTKKPPSTK